MKTPAGRLSALSGTFVACLVLPVAVVQTACDGRHRAMSPTAPTTVAPVVAPVAPWGGRFTELTIGEPMRVRETADDPDCIGLPGWRCQYFRFTPSRDGMLDVLLTYSVRPQPLDISVMDPRGAEWWYPVKTRVTANVTYDLIVWYTTPGQEFELGLSLE